MCLVHNIGDKLKQGSPSGSCGWIINKSMLLIEKMELLIFFIFLFWSIVLSLFLVYLALIIFPKTYTKPRKYVFKETPYECGFKPISNVEFPFDVHFYRVGILFLIFDIEIVFCFPWVVNFY